MGRRIARNDPADDLAHVQFVRHPAMGGQCFQRLGELAQWHGARRRHEHTVDQGRAPGLRVVEELLVELLARPQAGDLDLDVQVGLAAG